MTAKGLSPSGLAAAQQGDGFGVRGVAGQVVAAEALDREDRATRQEPAGLGDRVRSSKGSTRAARAQSGTSSRSGSAGRAGDGLRVEAAVGRIGVLAGAGGAHREAGHGGVGAVVGQAGDDGGAGSRD